MSLWKAKQDVELQDPHTPAVIAKFNEVHNSTTLAVEGTQFSYTITVDDPTGIVVYIPTVQAGSYIIIFNVNTGRFYTGVAIGLAGSVVTLDTQLDSTFPIGSFVDIAITNMNVDGSGTPRIFGLRGLGVIPGINVEVDITRIIFRCLTTTAVDLSKFANLPELGRGLALRKRDGLIHNIFNVKSNSEIDGITLDWKPYDAQNAQQGQHGFTARLTFAGQDKMGIAERLGVGEDLEILVQDNLFTGTPNIKLFEIVAEGSFVRQVA